MNDLRDRSGTDILDVSQKKSSIMKNEHRFYVEKRKSCMPFEGLEKMNACLGIIRNFALLKIRIKLCWTSSENCTTGIMKLRK